MIRPVLYGVCIRASDFFETPICHMHISNTVSICDRRDIGYIAHLGPNMPKSGYGVQICLTNTDRSSRRIGSGSL